MPEVSSYRDFRVSVKQLERISPSFLRVTFTGADLAHFGQPAPDHRIKVMLPLEGIGFSPLPSDSTWYEAWRALPTDLQNPIRTYTVRAARPERLELDIEFVLHGATGPASAWAEKCALGDEVIVIGPNAAYDGKYGGHDFNPPAGTHRFLIAGDETAAPAILNIVAALPADSTGLVVLEMPAALDQWSIPTPSGVDLVWLPRAAEQSAEPAAGQRTTDRGAELIPLVCNAAAMMVKRPQPVLDLEDCENGLLWDSPEEPLVDSDGFYAWFAGEAGMVKTLRRHLVSELGVDRKAVAFLGYWREGRQESN